MLQHDHSTSEITLKQLTTRQLTSIALAFLYANPLVRRVLADSTVSTLAELERRAPTDGEVTR